MKIMTNKRLEKLMSYQYNDGFRDAVESLVKAIESGEKIVLGNGTAYVGLKATAPMTIVGSDTLVTHSMFDGGKNHAKYPDRPLLNITDKL